MNYLRWIMAGLFVAVGIAWLLMPAMKIDTVSMSAVVATRLSSGTVARMDSPAFHYSPDWQISDLGADPAEPSDPFQTPSGVITFTYQGTDLALLLATGDYWGYLYATVDDQPANFLPAISANVDSRSFAAGYKPLYEPDNQRNDEAGTRWVRLHRATQPDAEQQVRLEIWRSWGQVPIRAVAVDALSMTTRPLWQSAVPFVLALLVLLVRIGVNDKQARNPRAPISGKMGAEWWIAGGVLSAVIAAVVLDFWWLSAAGLAILGLLGVMRPAIWFAAFLFGLPFYFAFALPVLPNRSLGIIDIGILGGVAVGVGNGLLSFLVSPASKAKRRMRPSVPDVSAFLLWSIAGWALLATLGADHLDMALREWRTVFLASAIFALLLPSALKSDYAIPGMPQHFSPFSLSSPQLIVGAWIAGSVAISLIGLYAYATDYQPYLVGTEGVTRLRSVYGSPNNLAAYLERSIAVCLALALFASSMRTKMLAALTALPQLLALLLTFSKGGIFLGAPAMAVALAVGGALFLRQQGRSARVLWWLVGLMFLAGMALFPVLGTERFRGLLDSTSPTSLMRLHLWRSAWQMALDHPWLGVGPDNFLYAYRSGYLLPEAWKEPNLNHPHNFILDWWTRLGLIGLLLGLAWWGEMIRRLYRLLASNLSTALSVGLLAAMIASLAHGLIDISYALPDLMIVWVLLGAIGQPQKNTNVHQEGSFRE